MRADSRRKESSSRRWSRAMQKRGDARLGAADGQAGEALAGLEELEAGGAVKAVRLSGEMLGDVVLGLGDELGGGGGGGGAEVGDEVGDGEVGFVADGGDDGEARGDDGAGHGFAVEGGQVFERAAAAGEDDEVDEIWMALRWAMAASISAGA